MALKISLAAARVNAGMTQAEAAEKIGVSPSSLKFWETGRRDISGKNLVKLSEVYNIPIENLKIFL